MIGVTQQTLLRLCVEVAGLVPVAAGLWGVFDMTWAALPWLITSYLSGLLLAIGLVFWSTARDIERKSQPFACLLCWSWAECRLAGVIVLGDSLSWSTSAALLMELVVTLALCLWLGRVAQGVRR